MILFFQTLGIVIAILVAVAGIAFVILEGNPNELRRTRRRTKRDTGSSEDEAEPTDQ
jgi:hypothetical protein